MPTTVLWLPLIAVAAHLCEEFVWPGGFAAWYRAYPPGYTASVSTRFLVVVNAIFVALAVTPILLGATSRAYAYWIVVAAIAGANGLFHLVATIRGRTYSPGVVTGVVLYVPLAVGGTIDLLRLRLVAPSTVAQAFLFALAYSVWSSWTHRRGAVARSAG